MERDERRRADALDRYWDATQRGETPRRPSDVNEVAAAVVDHLRSSPARPDINAAQLRVRQRIVAAANSTEETMDASAIPLLNTGRLARTPVGWCPPTTRHHHRMIRLALAALLLLALGYGVARIGPSLRDEGGPANVPAVVVLASEVATPADATPAVELVSRVGHPVIGVWQIDNDPSNPGTNIGWAVFDELGGYNETEGLPRVNVGTWQAPSERTAELVFVIQGVPRQYKFDPNDPPRPNVLSLEMELWRVTVTVDESGNAMTLAGHWDAYDASGVIVYSQEYVGTGTRMEIVTSTEGGTPTP